MIKLKHISTIFLSLRNQKQSKNEETSVLNAILKLNFFGYDMCLKRGMLDAIEEIQGFWFPRIPIDWKNQSWWQKQFFKKTVDYDNIRTNQVNRLGKIWVWKSRKIETLIISWLFEMSGNHCFDQEVTLLCWMLLVRSKILPWPL